LEGEALIRKPGPVGGGVQGVAKPGLGPVEPAARLFAARQHPARGPADECHLAQKKLALVQDSDRTARLLEEPVENTGGPDELCSRPSASSAARSPGSRESTRARASSVGSFSCFQIWKERAYWHAAIRRESVSERAEVCDRPVRRTKRWNHMDRFFSASRAS